MKKLEGWPSPSYTNHNLHKAKENDLKAKKTAALYFFKAV